MRSIEEISNCFEELCKRRTENQRRHEKVRNEWREISTLFEISLREMAIQTLPSVRWVAYVMNSRDEPSSWRLRLETTPSENDVLMTELMRRFREWDNAVLTVIDSPRVTLSVPGSHVSLVFPSIRTAIKYSSEWALCIDWTELSRHWERVGLWYAQYRELQDIWERV